MAASGLARPDVGRRLAVVVTAVGVALCGLLLGGPAAASAASPANGTAVRSAPGPMHQVGAVVRGAEVGTATVTETQQVVPVGASAAAPVRAVALHDPRSAFVRVASGRGDHRRGVDVGGVRGRAPPALRALAVH